MCVFFFFFFNLFVVFVPCPRRATRYWCEMYSNYFPVLFLHKEYTFLYLFSSVGMLHASMSVYIKNPFKIFKTPHLRLTGLWRSYEKGEIRITCRIFVLYLRVANKMWYVVECQGVKTYCMKHIWKCIVKHEWLLQSVCFGKRVADCFIAL